MCIYHLQLIVNLASLFLTQTRSMPIMSLEEKITDRSANVGIVGLGYVGLPLARAFIDAGYRVIGFDVDRVARRSTLAFREYRGFRIGGSFTYGY